MAPRGPLTRLAVSTTQQLPHAQGPGDCLLGESIIASLPANIRRPSPTPASAELTIPERDVHGGKPQVALHHFTGHVIGTPARGIRRQQRSQFAESVLRIVDSIGSWPDPLGHHGGRASADSARSTSRICVARRASTFEPRAARKYFGGPSAASARRTVLQAPAALSLGRSPLILGIPSDWSQIRRILPNPPPTSLPHRQRRGPNSADDQGPVFTDADKTTLRRGQLGTPDRAVALVHTTGSVRLTV